MSQPTPQDVFATYKDRVYRLALGMSGNADDAAEIAQEAFIKILRGLAGFRGESALATWIYTITRRTALDYLEKRHMHSNLVSLDAARLQAGTAPQDDWLATPEAAAQMRHAIAALPDDQQQAITLHYFAGHGVRDIAELLQATEGAVKSLLFRARKQLFNQLQRQFKISTAGGNA